MEELWNPPSVSLPSRYTYRQLLITDLTRSTGFKSSSGLRATVVPSIIIRLCGLGHLLTYGVVKFPIRQGSAVSWCSILAKFPTMDVIGIDGGFCRRT